MNRFAADSPHVILGAGDHARSLLGLLASVGRPVVGCIAPIDPPDGWPVGCPWLGDDTALQDLDPLKVALVNGLGSVGPTTRRRRVFDEARAKGFGFPVLVHPSAILAEGVTLAEGTQVLAGAILQSGVIVAENVLLNTGCILDHDCNIGPHVHLAPRVTLSGNSQVGAGAHLGTASTVIQGINIGTEAIVGAGAVVVRDVVAGRRVAGVPARDMDKPRRKVDQLQEDRQC